MDGNDLDNRALFKQHNEREEKIERRRRREREEDLFPNESPEEEEEEFVEVYLSLNNIISLSIIHSSLPEIPPWLEDEENRLFSIDALTKHTESVLMELHTALRLTHSKSNFLISYLARARALFD